MFQALFFQEREAAKDFKNHQTSKPMMPRSPKIGNPRVLPQPKNETSIKKRPTQSNVGGKGLFLNMDKKQ